MWTKFIVKYTYEMAYHKTSKQNVFTLEVLHEWSRILFIMGLIGNRPSYCVSHPVDSVSSSFSILASTRSQTYLRQFKIRFYLKSYQYTQV